LKNLLTNFPTYDIIGTEIEREPKGFVNERTGSPKNLKRKLKIPLDKTSRV